MIVLADNQRFNVGPRMPQTSLRARPHGPTGRQPYLNIVGPIMAGTFNSQVQLPNVAMDIVSRYPRLGRTADVKPLPSQTSEKINGRANLRLTKKTRLRTDTGDDGNSGAAAPNPAATPRTTTRMLHFNK